MNSECDRIVDLVARINELRARLYHESLDPEERRLIEEQIASFRFELARALSRN